MANIHLLYKVGFFSSTITFGFLSFFPFRIISGANPHSSENFSCSRARRIFFAPVRRFYVGGVFKVNLL